MWKRRQVDERSIPVGSAGCLNRLVADRYPRTLDLLDNHCKAAILDYGQGRRGIEKVKVALRVGRVQDAAVVGGGDRRRVSRARDLGDSGGNDRGLRAEISRSSLKSSMDKHG